ncbi:MAG: hypothetical protein PVJ84_08125 [Desulfobacteraceae bacterium]
MIKKRILNPDRIRKINRGFSFIPHRFLTNGFLADLDQAQALLYLFLVLAADRNGLSFYSYDSICNLLKLPLEQYIQDRDGLLEKVISFIEDDALIKKILIHLGLWQTRKHDPPRSDDTYYPAVDTELTYDDTYSQLPSIDHWTQ